MSLLPVDAFSQVSSVTLSGKIKEKDSSSFMPYVNVILKKSVDTSFVSGAVSDEEGLFTISGIKPGNYFLEVSYIGYHKYFQPIYVGASSEFLNLGVITLDPNIEELKVAVVQGQKDEVGGKMDKKSFETKDMVTQSGGTILQALQNLPGVSVQDGKIQLRGNDNVVILIDGKQTALTGFGGQYGLDNIPVSAIERIEIINNPSAKFDANGNAGIINIILKKEKKEGFSGKAGMSAGLGALWVRKENLPGIRPQYVRTPKLNPSIQLNYRKKNINLFFQADYLYTHTLNSNEFVTRTYDDGTIINQQTKRNRNTHFLTSRLGIDWDLSKHDVLSISGMFGTEKILDRGDEPFFNGVTQENLRLWQFLEDELKTTAMGIVDYRHAFAQAGHTLNFSFNYTFHRENEQYFFDNIYPTYTGHDAFKLLSDEQVADLKIDYRKPLRYGRLESGVKFRFRNIPTDMQFYPGLNSPLDSNAGGWANYKETIPALYGNYVFERKKFEAELGLRVEYVKVNYDVNPNHPTYKSNGYDYLQPFPNMRVAYKFSELTRLSLFFNRRVDRPKEVDIRIFPKYDDAEIIKVGNPALQPQFTNSLELGFKHAWKSGYFYGALFHRSTTGTITRIASVVPGSTLIYAVYQNAGESSNDGIECIWSQKVRKWYSFNLSLTGYLNQIQSFSVQNEYPVKVLYTSEKQSTYSGNIKLNNSFQLGEKSELQATLIYLAPDIIPQGKMDARFTMNLGYKKHIQDGKGELFVNASDLFNSLVIRKTIQGEGFQYTSTNYYETQVVRFGYSRRF